jgi:tRNA pseudouridine38-40 synthase
MVLLLRFWNLSTKRIKAVVAYDGTDFCGWASQTGLRTVQSTLTEAIRRVSGEEIEIVGASRTDAGAHAIGQVFHFDCRVKIPEHGWMRAINDLLPKDVAIQKVKLVSPDFHARFTARDRWYRYRICEGVRNPVEQRFSYLQWRKLDLEKMQEAGSGLLGRHDFRAFTAELDPWIENTLREMRKIEISRVGKEVRIDIVGTAFMRGMMRRIAGGLMEAGLGKRSCESLKELTLNPKSSELELPVVLPAEGLMLMNVRYGRKLRDIRNEKYEDE